MASQYRRSQILINKRFQLKFAFFVCTWIFALSMIYPLLIYNLFEYFVSYIQPAGQTLDAARLKEVQSQVIFWLGVLQLVFLGITFFISIFLSHRIAGPLFKLRRAMEEVTKGNLDQRITFRKHDHFTELADTFNEMVARVAGRKDSAAGKSS